MSSELMRVAHSGHKAADNVVKNSYSSEQPFVRQQGSTSAFKNESVDNEHMETRNGESCGAETKVGQDLIKLKGREGETSKQRASGNREDERRSSSNSVNGLLVRGDHSAHFNNANHHGTNSNEDHHNHRHLDPYHQVSSEHHRYDDEGSHNDTATDFENEGEDEGDNFLVRANDGGASSFFTSTPSSFVCSFSLPRDSGGGGAGSGASSPKKYGAGATRKKENYLVFSHSGQRGKYLDEQREAGGVEEEEGVEDGNYNDESTPPLFLASECNTSVSSLMCVNNRKNIDSGVVHVQDALKKKKKTHYEANLSPQQHQPFEREDDRHRIGGRVHAGGAPAEENKSAPFLCEFPPRRSNDFILLAAQLRSSSSGGVGADASGCEGLHSIPAGGGGGGNQPWGDSLLSHNHHFIQHGRGGATASTVTCSTATTGDGGWALFDDHDDHRTTRARGRCLDEEVGIDCADGEGRSYPSSTISDYSKRRATRRPTVAVDDFLREDFLDLGRNSEEDVVNGGLFLFPPGMEGSGDHYDDYEHHSPHEEERVNSESELFLTNEDSPDANDGNEKYAVYEHRRYHSAAEGSSYCNSSALDRSFSASASVSNTGTAREEGPEGSSRAARRPRDILKLLAGEAKGKSGGFEGGGGGSASTSPRNFLDLPLEGGRPRSGGGYSFMRSDALPVFCAAGDTPLHGDSALAATTTPAQQKKKKKQIKPVSSANYVAAIAKRGEVKDALSSARPSATARGGGGGGKEKERTITTTASRTIHAATVGRATKNEERTDNENTNTVVKKQQQQNNKREGPNRDGGVAFTSFELVGGAPTGALAGNGGPPQQQQPRQTVLTSFNRIPTKTPVSPPLLVMSTSTSGLHMSNTTPTKRVTPKRGRLLSVFSTNSTTGHMTTTAQHTTIDARDGKNNPFSCATTAAGEVSFTATYTKTNNKIAVVRGAAAAGTASLLISSISKGFTTTTSSATAARMKSVLGLGSPCPPTPMRRRGVSPKALQQSPQQKQQLLHHSSLSSPPPPPPNLTAMAMSHATPTTGGHHQQHSSPSAYSQHSFYEFVAGGGFRTSRSHQIQDASTTQPQQHHSSGAQKPLLVAAPRAKAVSVLNASAAPPSGASQSVGGKQCGSASNKKACPHQEESKTPAAAKASSARTASAGKDKAKKMAPTATAKKSLKKKSDSGTAKKSKDEKHNKIINDNNNDLPAHEQPPHREAETVTEEGGGEEEDLFLDAHTHIREGYVFPPPPTPPVTGGRSAVAVARGSGSGNSLDENDNRDASSAPIGGGHENADTDALFLTADLEDLILVGNDDDVHTRDVDKDEDREHARDTDGSRRRVLDEEEDKTALTGISSPVLAGALQLQQHHAERGGSRRRLSASGLGGGSPSRFLRNASLVLVAAAVGSAGGGNSSAAGSPLHHYHYPKRFINNATSTSGAADGEATRNKRSLSPKERRIEPSSHYSSSSSPTVVVAVPSLHNNADHGNFLVRPKDEDEDNDGGDAMLPIHTKRVNSQVDASKTSSSSAICYVPSVPSSPSPSSSPLFLTPPNWKEEKLSSSAVIERAHQKRSSEDTSSRGGHHHQEQEEEDEQDEHYEHQPVKKTQQRKKSERKTIAAAPLPRVATLAGISSKQRSLLLPVSSSSSYFADPNSLSVHSNTRSQLEKSKGAKISTPPKKAPTVAAATKPKPKVKGTLCSGGGGNETTPLASPLPPSLELDGGSAFVLANTTNTAAGTLLTTVTGTVSASTLTRGAAPKPKGCSSPSAAAKTISPPPQRRAANKTINTGTAGAHYHYHNDDGDGDCTSSTPSSIALAFIGAASPAPQRPTPKLSSSALTPSREIVPASPAAAAALFPHRSLSPQTRGPYFLQREQQQQLVRQLQSEKQQQSEGGGRGGGVGEESNSSSSGSKLQIVELARRRGGGGGGNANETRRETAGRGLEGGLGPDESSGLGSGGGGIAVHNRNPPQRMLRGRGGGESAMGTGHQVVVFRRVAPPPPVV